MVYHWKMKKAAMQHHDQILKRKIKTWAQIKEYLNSKDLSTKLKNRYSHVLFKYINRKQTHKYQQYITKLEKEKRIIV